MMYEQHLTKQFQSAVQNDVLQLGARQHVDSDTVKTELLKLAPSYRCSVLPDSIKVFRVGDTVTMANATYVAQFPWDPLGSPKLYTITDLSVPMGSPPSAAPPASPPAAPTAAVAGVAPRRTQPPLSVPESFHITTDTNAFLNGIYHNDGTTGGTVAKTTYKTCSLCAGTGYIHGITGLEVCGQCGGTGHGLATIGIAGAMVCPTCSGYGHVHDINGWVTCPRCGGKGWIPISP